MCDRGVQPTVCREVCGDGRRVREECDDGNTVSGDGCSQECKVEEGYRCEGGGIDRRDVCYERCGDGVNTQYECDDGNMSDGDGCNSVCKVELGWNCTKENSICKSVCGDGIRIAKEECDDQN